jgi:hypothetical protein
MHAQTASASRAQSLVAQMLAGTGVEPLAPGGSPEPPLVASAEMGESRLDDGELKEILASLTLQRELDTGRKDFLGRFDEAAIAWDTSRPWVDLRTQGVIWNRTEAISGKTPSGRRFAILIAHDVDRTTAMEPFSLINSLARSCGLRRSSWWPLRTSLSRMSLVRNLERILELEKARGIGAHYFMLAGPFGFGRYSSRTDARWFSARETARLIQAAGMSIGLHGSFAARDVSGYKIEKDSLEQNLGCAVTCHRNHYLRFDPISLYSQLEEAGIRYDWSVGFVTRIGFRAGTAQCYQAFDLGQGRISAVRSVPQLFMDTVLQSHEPAEVLTQLRSALAMVRDTRGCVCFVFHPETFLLDPRAWPLFEDILQMCEEMGGDLSGELPSN